jgi:hypothetical protein
MQKAQKEVYGTERNVVADAVETAKKGEYKKAIAELGDGALDTLVDAQTKEKISTFIACLLAEKTANG